MSIESKDWYKDYCNQMHDLDMLESIAIEKIKEGSLELEKVRESKNKLGKEFIDNLKIDDVNVIS